MKTFRYLSADARLTDELERQLMRDALSAQEQSDLVSDVRHLVNFGARKMSRLFHAQRARNHHRGDYRYS